MSIALDFTFVLKARRFEDLMLPGEERDHAFKRLAKIYHPDKHVGKDSDLAKKVFQHINALHTGPTTPPVTIGKWVIRDPFASGDIADLFLTEDGSLFKIARSRKDNDLMDREAAALKKLPEKTDKSTMDHYAPKLLDSFSASGRRVNVLEYKDGYIPLQEISSRLGGTIDFRHIVWMMNRLLSIAGWAHSHDIVHGAIVPSHILYRPNDHDLALVDWCYSQPTGAGERIKAVVPMYKSLYAPEIFSPRGANAGMDVYMAFRSIRHSLQFSVPKRFESLFEWALVDSPASRPSAWHLQNIWRQAAKEEYGEPKFINLELPVH